MGWLVLIGVGVAAILVILESRRPSTEPPVSTPEPLEQRSFYCLEISYDFDGGRASVELFVYRSLQFVRQCIDQVLLPSWVVAREHVVWQFSKSGGGATAHLLTFDHGRVVSRVSLTESLRAEGPGTSARLDIERNQAEAEALAKVARLTLDWEDCTRSVPALTGALLLPGERATIEIPESLVEPWPNDDEPSVAYGFQDLQYPDSPAVEFDDPDPVTNK